jgi:hypothetical protein
MVDARSAVTIPDWQHLTVAIPGAARNLHDLEPSRDLLCLGCVLSRP